MQWGEFNLKTEKSAMDKINRKGDPTDPGKVADWIRGKLEVCCLDPCVPRLPDFGHRSCFV